MDNSISNTSESDYRGLLSKGVWSHPEAACIFAQVNPEACIKRHSVHKLVYLVSPRAQSLFEIIKTWSPEIMQAKPCWYIDKMIKEYNNVSELLLNAVKNYFLNLLPKERDIFLIDYPYLARKLNLSSDEKKPSLNEDLEFKDDGSSLWMKNAEKIYVELRLGREHLSKEQMSKIVSDNMQKRHAAKEGGMTKRGGKVAPSASTILRHVLNNL